jgi:hypothetical protein
VAYLSGNVGPFLPEAAIVSLRAFKAHTIVNGEDL